MSVPKILVIDDSASIVEVARIALEMIGKMEVRSFATGQEALDLLPSWRPDLILLDYHLPDMDGPAILKHIQENPITASIPVVFLTGRAKSHEMEEYRRMGAKATLTKPFDPDRLVQDVRDLLE